MLKIEQFRWILSFLFLSLTTKSSYGRPVQFVIDEEIDQNTVIGNLLNHVPGTFNNLRFVKIINAEDASGLFRVDQYSGEISASSRLDRETLCMNSDSIYQQKFISDETLIKPKNWKPRISNSGECELQFSVNCLSTQLNPSSKTHVSSSTSKLVTMFDVTIILQDLNDNGCKFLPTDHQVIRIREDAPLHQTRFVLHSPYDPDNPWMGHSIKPDRIWIQNAQDPLTLGLLGQHRFEFQNVFKLHAIPNYKNHTGKLKSLTNLVHLELELIGTLDYEQKSNYTFDVVADDGISMAGHQCHLQVNILVEDCNDHLPKFEQSIFIANLTEDVPIGHLVVQLNATDQDTGDFGRIIYTVKSYDDDDDEDEDGDSGLHSNIHASITNGHDIVQDAEQPDTGTNPYFYVNPTNGEVRLQRRLNFRQKSQHSLRIRAKNPDQVKSKYDHIQTHTQSQRVLHKPDEAIAQVLINVIDINDQAPKIRVFSPTGSIFLEILEESLPGQDVAVIDVSDEDSGINADLNCQLIQQSVPGLLTLVPMDMERLNSISSMGPSRTIVNGNRKYKISLQNSVDREQITSVDFVISCWDGGNPSLSTNSSQTIKIVDINDNSPVFEKEIYMLKTYEDSDPKRAAQDFYLATITASDKDEGLNAKLKYSLDHGTPTNLLNILKIDPDTGRLSTTGSLDRELMTELSVMIVCTDMGEPSRSAKVLVNINILDHNDNSPEFSEPNIEFELRENNPIGQLLGSFQIYDKDIGSNSDLDIHIETDSDRSHIFMSPTYSTQLNTHKRSYDMIALNSESAVDSIHDDNRNTKLTPKFRLVAQKMLGTKANDLSRPMDSTVYDVKIYAESIVDRESLLVKQTNFLSKTLSGIKSDEHSVQWDHTVSGSGLTSDSYGMGLSSGGSSNTNIARTMGANNGLNIQTNNGSYFTPIIVLIIRAADHGLPKLINRASVRIRILDENDNLPRFIYPDPMNTNTTQINVSHNEPIGYIFGQIYAIDDDAGLNGTVNYYIRSGNRNDYFKMDPNTGSLSVNQDLSYAPLGEYRLRIEARDCGQPYKSNFIDIRIILDDSPSKAYLSMDIYKWNSGTIFDFGATGSVLNMYIIIAIVAAAFVISVILLGSIFYFLHRSRRNRIYRHVTGTAVANESGNIGCKYGANPLNSDKSTTNWATLTKLPDYELEAKPHTFTDIHECPACTSSYPLVIYPDNFGTLNKPNCGLMNGSVRITPNFEHYQIMTQQQQQQQQPIAELPNGTLSNQSFNWSSDNLPNQNHSQSRPPPPHHHPHHHHYQHPLIDNETQLEFYIPPQSMSDDMNFKSTHLETNFGSPILHTNDRTHEHHGLHESTKVATVRLPGQHQQHHQQQQRLHQLLHPVRNDVVSDGNPFNNLQYIMPISSHWQVSSPITMECTNSILSADCDSGNGDSLEIVPPTGIVHIPRT